MNERSGQVEAAVLQAEELLQQRRLDDALQCFDQAEQMGANANRCAAGRWLAFMLRGEFQSAWRESDEIRRRTSEDQRGFWLGEHLRGKRVILRCLHGFGDAIQFLRFVPRLQALASQLIVEVPPKLLELAPHLDGMDEVITWGEEAPPQSPVWDVQVEINELAYLLRLDASELPGYEQYLKLPQEILSQTAPQANDERSLKVGLVWAGGEWNTSRSLPFAHVEIILKTQGCEFWNLQGGDARDAWPTVGAHHLHDADACRDSILALAATIAQVDLVITSDTLAAHLAGAQGIPCWVLLQHAADWRWMHDRIDTPWYPSLRLFRRDAVEDWSSLLVRVAEALRTAAANHTLEPQAAMTVSSS